MIVGQPLHKHRAGERTGGTVRVQSAAERRTSGEQFNIVVSLGRDQGERSTAPSALFATTYYESSEGAVTVPITPDFYIPAPAPSAQDSIRFPLSWLLEHAPAPIKFRAVTEVARIPTEGSSALSSLPYTYEPALLLALLQGPDGTWPGGMLAVPSSAQGFNGVGTISAVQRLLEYGWERDSPPLLQARRVLFRLLAEDDDASYLFELVPRGRADIDRVRHGRSILREAAAAALAQAGYGHDPRLRGAARRITERVDAFLRSPLAEKPFIRSGNQHVLPPEAAPPSIYLLEMLAFMPHFRNEHYDFMERLYAAISQPLPRQAAASLVGDSIVAEPHLVLGDQLPHRSAVDGDIPAALQWLELMARLGMIRRNEGWTKLFERFLGDCDSEGVWKQPGPGRRAPTISASTPYSWPTFPLSPDTSPDSVRADVTFRLGVIGRYGGWGLEVE